MVKGLFHFRKTRYRGLRKQAEKLNMMFALANRYLADKRGLLAWFELPPADIWAVSCNYRGQLRLFRIASPLCAVLP